MKKTLYIALFFILYGSTSAQEVMKSDRDRNYVLLGLGISQRYMSNPGLNFVLDRYNETRQGNAGQATVTKEMGHISLLTGYGGSLVFKDNKLGNGLYLTVDYSKVKGMATAEATAASGPSGSRQVKLNSSALGFNFGYMVLQSLFLDAGLAAGTSVYFNKLSSRINEDPFAEAGNHADLGLTLSGIVNVFISRKFPFSLSARPYYSWSVLRNDFSDLNEGINPFTASGDSPELQKGRYSHFGLSIHLNLMLMSRKQKAVDKVERKKTTKKTTRGFE